MHANDVRPTTSPARFLPWLSSWARGGALFFSLFTLSGLAGELFSPGADASLWWIDLRAWPLWLSRPFLWSAALLLGFFGIRPPQQGWRRLATVCAALVLALWALVDSGRFYWLLAQGDFSTPLPVPLSLGLALFFGGVAWTAFHGGRGPWFGVLLSLVCWGIGFPVAQMLCFGLSDYQRPAEVAIVFGARAYADGSASRALSDRVDTACELYRRGWVKKLYFSGGPGDGDWHETDVMRARSIAQGVRPDDIWVDLDGLNTRHTAENTTRGLQIRGVTGRVLAVSHFYHVPRVKLAFQREGLEVYTVPAVSPQGLRRMPYYMLREIVGLWAYYAGALFPMQSLGG